MNCILTGNAYMLWRTSSLSPLVSTMRVVSFSVVMIILGWGSAAKAVLMRSMSPCLNL